MTLKSLISGIALIVTISLTAQNEGNFGIRAGLNYNGNGDYFNSVSQTSESPEKNVGFHIGIFGKIGGNTYFKPELVYTSTKSKYDDDSFSMKKIDAPLLIGTKLFGPIHGFVGPSLQYIVDTEFDGIKIEDVKSDFTIGFTFGFGINLKTIGIDLRYERGFSDNEATFIGNNTNNATLVNKIDTRPDQLILSISVAL